MKSFVFFFSWVALFSVTAGGQDSPSEEEKKEPEAPKPIATLDIKNSKEGSIPGGSNTMAGKWKVSAEKTELQVLTEPLVVSRLEFGPEVREKGATIVATGCAPGKGRIQSRFGAGLYGKNGFHLRLVPLSDEIELVRRGEVLQKVEMPIEPDRSYTIELTVRAEEDQWVLQGFVWDSEKGAEKAVAIGYRIYDEELLFPLAGRAVLTGTPFSGEPVSFSRAEMYPDGYIREEEAEESDDSDDESTEGESEEESN